jgi:hypothetical protein
MESAFQANLYLVMLSVPDSCNRYQAALSESASAVKKKNVIEFDLDVNAPRKRVKQGKQSRKQGDNVQEETLLHAACKLLITMDL